LVQRLEAAGIDLASVTDVVLTYMHMDHVGGLLADGVKVRLRPDLRVHVAAAEAEFWASPDFSRVSMPPGFPDALRRTATRFLNEYHSRLRLFENEYEVALGVLVTRTGGHTPGHSVVRLASGGDRLTSPATPCFRSDSSTPTGTTALNTTPKRRPASGSSAGAAANRESLVATHLSFRPSAMRRSPATSFVGYRPSGSTDRLFNTFRGGAIAEVISTAANRREQCQTISRDLALDHRLATNDLICVTCTHSSRSLTKTEP
jgi:hypothetical protein